jgi:hypothetical protein
MKKKLISSGIILFVLSYVLVAGFLIVKTSFTDGYSNAQLLANFLAPMISTSSVSIVHLANANSAVAQPTFQQQLSIASYAEISPIVASDSASMTTTTSSTDNTTTTATSTTTTTTIDTDNNLASNDTDTATSFQNTSTAEQNLEVLAATLIHLEMSSATTLK